MHSYESLRQKHGRRVPQTVDSPILVFDYFELSDIFVSFAIVLVCGVLMYAWWLMIALLLLFLGAGPVIKRKHPKGIFFHWPYRHLKMSLPGLISPNERYSD